MPDVLILPDLARLYEVTVDDFYKKSTVAYDNYAQRLASVYEKSRDPEDFMRCRIEYEKLMKNGELSTEDKWLYAWIHMYMLNYCRDVAVEWYDKAVSSAVMYGQESCGVPAVHHSAKTYGIVRVAPVTLV